ncbi:MAG: hypothetical protein L0I76_24445 [Pseudonocardia sp.]|nr:hypothetical protein [Pseudonocardia sp.]
MSPAGAARAALMAGLARVPDLRVYDDLAAVVDPPGAVVGPPRLTPDGYGPDLVNAVFVVGLVAPASDRALDVLFDLVQPVCDAIYEVPGAVVTECSPGTWPAGAASLPAYLVEVEMSL